MEFADEGQVMLLQLFDNLDMAEMLAGFDESSKHKVARFSGLGKMMADGMPECPNSAAPSVCPMCMRHAMMRVMRHVTLKVRDMCQSSCPKMQKVCAWAASHR